MNDRLNTSRLALVLADASLLLACVEGGDALASRLAAHVTPDWPPEHIDGAALRWSLAALEAGRTPPPWGFYLILLRDPMPTLIGTCGFKGPPDADGVVEVGYSVVPSHQRQGHATEAVQGLIACAFAAGAQSVAAETLPHLTASLKVMERCGLRPCETPSAPGVVRRIKTRAD